MANSNSVSGAGFRSSLNNNPKYRIIAILAFGVIVLGGVLLVRNRLQYTDTSANCYGYGCKPKPSIYLAGRVANYGSGNWSRHNMIAKKGQQIEITWSAQNVEYCKAVNSWTQFTGTNYPPTLYQGRFTDRQSFGVQCFNGNRLVVSDDLVLHMVGGK